jgi:deoxyadenosine/deoxycytidine kinase
MSKTSPVIAISGMIGAGKTTLALILEKEFNLEIIHEPVDENPILKKFYQDPTRYGFSLQMYFLNQRFGAIQHALWHGGKILDRHFGEDIVFARQNHDAGNIDDTDFQTYTAMLENMKQSLRGLPQSRPDLTIYLSASFDHILSNIQKRARPYEQADDDSNLKQYYFELWSQYQPWFEDYHWSPKLKLDMDQIDLNNQESIESVIKSIRKALTHE